MATGKQANDTFTRTREFYKNGSKSANKFYFDLKDQITNLQKEINESTGGWLGFAAAAYFSQEAANLQNTKSILYKRNDRNTKTTSNKDAVDVAREKWVGKTYKEIAANLYGQACTLGNCGEMSLVSSYIAQSIIESPVSPNEITFFANKGHQFLVLGSDPNDQMSFAVDPWLNVCSPMSRYKEAALSKLGQWAQKNKRILVPGSGWMSPDSQEVLNIWDVGWNQFKQDGVYKGKGSVI